MPVSKKRAGVKQKQSRRAKPNMPEQTKQNSERTEKEVEIDYIVPETLPTLYSDNFLVQNREAIFFMYFMLNQYPIVLKPEELLNIDRVKSVCLTKISTTSLQFARNLKAMEENFERFLKSINSPAKDYRQFLEMVEKGERVTNVKNK
jgi:hypothetical protein